MIDCKSYHLRTLQINVQIFSLKDIFFQNVLKDFMDRTVILHVTTNVMVVTTLTVPVIEDVNLAGRETTVNNVMYSILTMI